MTVLGLQEMRDFNPGIGAGGADDQAAERLRWPAGYLDLLQLPVS